jgi:hypothetical protein
MVSAERREQMRQAGIRYRERNKDDLEYKEKMKKYKQKYRQSENGQQKTKEYREQWYSENKEAHSQYRKEGIGKKYNTICRWKTYGVIHDDFDALYELYINTNECNICNKVFTDSYYRCLDHDHNTGLFRHILCRTCNNQDNWKKVINQTSS